MQFWSHSYRKDVMKQERVHKGFTRMTPGYARLSYGERLDWEDVFLLEPRKLIEDTKS